VGDLWSGFIWLGIGSSGRFVDWIYLARDRDQWEIYGLD
jgi:hypothetical protein